MDERIEPCFLGTLMHGSLQVPPAGDRGVLELFVTVIAVVLRDRHGKITQKNHIQKRMSVLSNQPFQLKLLQSSPAPPSFFFSPVPPAPSTEIMLKKKKHKDLFINIVRNILECSGKYSFPYAFKRMLMQWRTFLFARMQTNAYTVANLPFRKNANECLCFYFYFLHFLP